MKELPKKTRGLREPKLASHFDVSDDWPSAQYREWLVPILYIRDRRFRRARNICSFGFSMSRNERLSLTEREKHRVEAKQKPPDAPSACCLPDCGARGASEVYGICSSFLGNSERAADGGGGVEEEHKEAIYIV